MDEERREIAPKDLLDDAAFQRLRRACASATRKIVRLHHLLQFSDQGRFAVLDLCTVLGSDAFFVVSDDGKSHRSLFDAVLARVCDTRDMERCRRAKDAALETAALMYPDALAEACDRIVKRLRELKISGVKRDELLKKAR